MAARQADTGEGDQFHMLGYYGGDPDWNRNMTRQPGEDPATPWTEMLREQQQRRRMNPRFATPGGPNLRGTGARVARETLEQPPERPAPAANPPATEDKPTGIFLTKDEKLEVVVKDMPEDLDEFERWLKSIKASIAQNATDPFQLKAWFETAYAPGVQPHHLVVEAGSPYAVLEHRLYTAVLGSVKGGRAVKHFNDMEGDMVEFAHVRQAIHCLY